ncbi:putative disease resistance protein RGA1 [Neltuma alba]|uniref:putative disease resistance protein RGA1 n=1 Tax=Neltuma alba TaxID=207710 RepID=UPI0010A36D0E|nr:putative disease resistance protein RGA1 [Prosopis alba]
MAEQVPYGVATSLINTLASLAFKEIASIYGVETEIDWLEETVGDIKAVLADADHKHTEQSIQRWITKLKQVLYEADDVLDEIHTKHLLRQRDGKGKVRDFFSSSNPIAFRCKIACEIRRIKEQFNAVTKRMSELNLVGRVVEMKHEKRNRRETSSFVLQERMVGREGNKKHIIDLLLNDDNSHQNVSLVAIVGIGGLGKTALAQLVYNDADVDRFFQKRMWVCVSEDSDATALVKQTLKSLPGQKHDEQSLELLQNELQKNLAGQKFLLVLDDIWDDFPRKWEDLENILMRGAKGSKILLTTRDQAVVNRMGVKTPYLLEGLNNDQSWTLLKRLAFDDEKIMTQNLESIGQKIAAKCKGVPLAIRVMGSLLRSKLRESDWEDLLKDDFWKLRDDNVSIIPILKLSYDSLAIELKQCFAYCSIYPKDWRYNKDELIDMWMAQGFLENKDEEQCLEDVGEEYVHVLLMKSFLQDVERDESGEIESFKMHDLMHDLSQSVASSDLYVEGGKNGAMCPIHASFEKYNTNRSLNMPDLGRLRTFHEMKKEDGRDLPDLFVFKRLRSLDLSNSMMRYLPKSIGKMIHLRHLNLSSCSQLTCLPKSISNLVNLQTLILSDCYNLKFPGDIITKLVKLRRLDIEDCKAFDDGMPMGLGKMTCMQRLSHFIVGNDDKEIKKAKLNELKDLNLRGRLAIKKLDSVRDIEEESKNVNLRTKKNLISLSMDWGNDPKMEKSDAMQLLENLRPHQNLRMLEIYGYPGGHLPDYWLLSCTNLVQLQFSGFKDCQYLPALEGLVSLKTLDISRMDKLECIYYKGCSSSANFFPSLEELTISRCGSLRGWQREANGQNTRDNEWHDSLPPFLRLLALSIWGCPHLRCMPAFPNLVRDLDLFNSSMKPLVDTLSVGTIGPSTSHDMTPSLSMLKSLHIRGIEMEALPEEWMQNLSSLKHLSIRGFSSLEKPFLHMRNLSATLEELTIQELGDEDYSIQCQDLCCLCSLQAITFSFCDHLTALPEWICDLQSLRSMCIFYCKNLELFPAEMSRLTTLQTLSVYRAPLLEAKCKRETGAEWLKIAHIPNIWI